ncbi:hypothetical protein RR11_782 [Ruegeria sp. R11]|jgi:hypothetical protein|uniref:Uncharacterized protein n=1 Tax=Phaeobacter italicus TaxID=481446 RepID=A0A0H5D3N3_9RHOB|nr:hypothetical protein RR11_782 [Ruegeria sp. R11]CRL11353.1 hypothetical protein NIT7321_02208 [Phaeobacter italicus]CRL14285.1 hypothetical protein NIT7645_01311 [Phaeobacter italicus]SFG23897.1 hypothetical protein SAMN04488019_101647 [Phaeobacter italicus]
MFREWGFGLGLQGMILGIARRSDLSGGYVYSSTQVPA